MTKRSAFICLAIAVMGVLAACSTPEISPAMRPLSKDTMMLLGKMGMKVEAPIFVRIFKEESELEIWKIRDDGRYYHFKTYPICTWSGDLGPKLQHGDKQAPEGFYTIQKSQLNPNSSFHLAFNLGYPNNYDRAHGRTGSALMIHGKCRSAGCYAMTDALIEEIYALARDQFTGEQEAFQVHAFPFRMTTANMARYRKHQWYSFWSVLKEGYDHFETTRQVPPIEICEKRYHVNVKPLHQVARIDPEGRCPAFGRPAIEAFMPKLGEKVAVTHVVAPGQKLRDFASESHSTSILSGLLSSPQSRPTYGFGGASN